LKQTGAASVRAIILQQGGRARCLTPIRYAAGAALSIELRIPGAKPPRLLPAARLSERCRLKLRIAVGAAPGQTSVMRAAQRLGTVLLWHLFRSSA
jgi:hypothetical protein